MAPVAVALKKSRRLEAEASGADAASCPQACPQQFMKRQRGSREGFIKDLLVEVNGAGAGGARLVAGTMPVKTAPTGKGPPSNGRLLQLVVEHRCQTRSGERDSLQGQSPCGALVGGGQRERAIALLDRPLIHRPLRRLKT